MCPRASVARNFGHLPRRRQFKDAANNGVIKFWRDEAVGKAVSSRHGADIVAWPGELVDLIEHDPGPFAEALRAPAPTASSAASSTRLPTARSVPSLLNTTPGTAASLESLIDQYRVSAGPRTVVGALPVTVAFPDVGPSLFMAAELTSESTSPVLQLSLRRSRQ